jgi:N-methylhydantoinase B
MTIQTLGASRQFRFAPFFDRLRFPARGFAGGLPGAPGEYRLSDGRHPNPKETLWLDPEVQIAMQLPGGGGFHDPLERDPSAVLDDVRDGYVSPEAARSAYGVVLAGDAVDESATRELRAVLSAGSSSSRR